MAEVEYDMHSIPSLYVRRSIGEVDPVVGPCVSWMWLP